MNIVEYALNKKMSGGGGGDTVIPEGYVKPKGTVILKENGTHDVSAYKSARVDTYSFEKFVADRNSYEYLFYGTEGSPKVTTVPYIKDAISTAYMFSHCTYLESVPLFDTSNIENMEEMFSVSEYLEFVPLFNTSNVTNMRSMFLYCRSLKSVPMFDTSNVASMNSMFEYCSALTTVPLFDTSNVTNMNSMFSNARKLKSVPKLDMRNVTRAAYMFVSCEALTDVRLRNIRADIQVGSGDGSRPIADYGYNLTVDSLTHLIYELRDTGSSTLTVGSANLKKLANVYVKPIEITDEMRAEDDLIDEKLPFVVCESTDEGACLIEDYMAFKNWRLA